MNSIAQPTVAADYMQRDVVTVSPADTLREALALMTENHVTGLPVMDSKSRCIGLVTASDILAYEQEQADETEVDVDTADFFDPDTEQWSTIPVSAFGLEKFGDVRVSEVMTRELIWAERTAPLKTVARRMIDECVHRILVMDDRGNLYGIISAVDLVRVVAES